MDPESRIEIVRIVSELNTSINDIQKSIAEVLNGTAPPENFQKIIEEWKEKRQLINNLGIGIIISLSQARLIIFPLKGDSEKDLGQKRFDDPVSLSSEQIIKLDKKFLDLIRVRQDEDLEKL